MSQTDPSEVTSIIKAKVKWFSPQKQYGFLVDDHGNDILLHLNALQGIGLSSITAGIELEVNVRDFRGRKQVLDILSAALPTQDDATHYDQAQISESELDNLPALPARVKWYDPIKGYGFANLYEKEGDVFIPAVVLRVAGLTELAIGEAIAIKVIHTEKGLAAAQILRWPTGGREQ